jgi:methyl-accepting chemotaxis protein
MMSIRLRILAVLSVMLVLACGLAFYGIRSISSAGDLVVRLYDGPLMGINHARAAHAALNEARLILQQGQSVGASDEALAKFEKLVKGIFEDLGVVRERIQAANVNSIREQAEGKVREWSNAALKILKPTPGGLTELPTSFAVKKLGDSAIASVDDLVEIVAAYGYDFRNEAEANVSASRLTMIAAAAGGLVLGLVFAIGFAYSLSRPISALAKSMLELANGNFEVVLPGLRRNDEVGHVARAVETFKALAQQKARDEAEAKIRQDEVIAQQRKSDMRNVADSFEAVVGQIVRAVSSTSTELESSANTLTGTAQRAKELTTVVAKASEEASTNVQSVASATEQLSSSVNEISRQVQESARMASDAVDQARSTTERVGELSQAATRIGDVVELINAIAGQTNLLALNATIEALRSWRRRSRLWPSRLRRRPARSGSRSRASRPPLRTRSARSGRSAERSSGCRKSHRPSRPPWKSKARRPRKSPATCSRRRRERTRSPPTSSTCSTAPMRRDPHRPKCSWQCNRCRRTASA